MEQQNQNGTASGTVPKTLSILDILETVVPPTSGDEVEGHVMDIIKNTMPSTWKKLQHHPVQRADIVGIGAHTTLFRILHKFLVKSKAHLIENYMTSDYFKSIAQAALEHRVDPATVEFIEMVCPAVHNISNQIKPIVAFVYNSFLHLEEVIANAENTSAMEEVNKIRSQAKSNPPTPTQKTTPPPQELKTMPTNFDLDKIAFAEDDNDGVPPSLKQIIETESNPAPKYIDPPLHEQVILTSQSDEAFTDPKGAIQIHKTITMSQFIQILPPLVHTIEITTDTTNNIITNATLKLYIKHEHYHTLVNELPDLAPILDQISTNHHKAQHQGGQKYQYHEEPACNVISLNIEMPHLNKPYKEFKPENVDFD